MSAGEFVETRYQDNSGAVFPGTVQPETLALTVAGTANAPTADAINQRVSFKVSKTNGEIGCGPRKANFFFTTAAPSGYAANQTYSQPIMTQAVGALVSRGVVGTYLGEDITFRSLSPESIR